MTQTSLSESNNSREAKDNQEKLIIAMEGCKKKKRRKLIKKILSNMLPCLFSLRCCKRKKSSTVSTHEQPSLNPVNNNDSEFFSANESSFISAETLCFNYSASQLELAKKHEENVPSKFQVKSNPSSTIEKNYTSSSTIVNERPRYPNLVSWEILADKVKLDSFIGRGSYGTVHKCNYYGKAAIKIIHVQNPSEEHMESFRNEISVLQKLRHEYILLFMGCIVHPYLAIVTEWCDGYSLYMELHKKRRIFRPLTILYIARQFAEGMTYLHSKSIIHCDLKSNNVFMTNVGVIKIGDFGLATLKTMVTTGVSNKPKIMGSVYWMAPEIIWQRNNNGPSHASDVYAFGIVLYELVTSTLPYSELDHRHQILFMVGSSKKPLNMEKSRSDLPHAFIDLIHRCSSYDFESRPAFNEISQEMLRMIDKYPKNRRSLSTTELIRLR